MGPSRSSESSHFGRGRVRAAAAATAAAVAAAALAAVAILTAAVVVVALTAAATTFHLAAPAPSSWASGQRFLLRNRQRSSPRRRKYVYIAISLIKLIKIIRTRSRGIALYRGVSRCIANTIRRKLLVRVGVTPAPAMGNHYHRGGRFSRKLSTPSTVSVSIMLRAITSAAYE